MQILIELAPLVAFIASWAVAGIYVATAVLMGAMVLLVGWDWISKRSIPKMHLMSALLMRTPDAVATLGDADAAHRWFDGVVAQQATIGFDAHDYLYQSWAYERHDVGRTPGFGGDTRAALAAISARALLLAPPLDLFNPAGEARSAAAAIPAASFVEIPSQQGHLAATSTSADDAAFLDREISAFLA